MSGLLFLAALGAAGLGVYVRWASSCCGSRDAPPDLPLVLGLTLAAVLCVVAAGMVSRGLGRRALLAWAGAVPVTTTLASLAAPDMVPAAVTAIAGWLALRRYLGRPAVAVWLDGDRS